MSSSNYPSKKIPAIAHAVGGSIGSALALLLLYPLERTRIEVQTVVARMEAIDEEAASDERSTSDGSAKANGENNPELLACFKRVWERGEMYKGAGPLAWTLGISNFIFFFVNTFVKSRIQGLYPDKEIPRILALLASCLAGSINVLMTNPIWSTNLRIVSNQSTHKSFWKELMHVSQTLGPQHLWHGTTASLLLVSNPVIQFFCYEQIKALRLSHLRRTTGQQRPNLSAPEAFLLGALAKAVATCTTYPLQLTKAVLWMQLKRPMTAQSGSDKVDDDDEQRDDIMAFKRIVRTLLGIYQRDGWRGLYTGMKAKLLQTVLTAAFTFLTYEQILAAVYAAHQKLIGAPVAAGRGQAAAM